MKRGPSFPAPKVGHLPPRTARAVDNQRVELLSIRVTLLLDAYEIEGNIYVVPEMRRFSDAWESLMRDPRSFIPISDALITPVASRKEQRVAFVQLKKADIRAVYPVARERSEDRDVHPS